jgi:long-chain acyl-CoA synthetase
MPNVAESLWTHAENSPERLALRGPDSRWTYRELRDRAAAFGGSLVAAGIRPGDRVLLVAPTVPEFVAAYFGAHAAGAAVVTGSPLATAPELAHLIADSTCALVLAWHEAGPSVTRAAGTVPVRTLHHGLADITARPLARPHPAGADDTAVILYTSGTTGRPKGAELTHGNLIACAEIFTRVLAVRADDVFGTALPMFHIFGQAVVVGTALRAGIGVSLSPSFDPTTALETIRAHRVSVFFGVPTMYNALLHSPHEADVSSLRLAASGGASLPAEVLRACHERFGCVILEGYGMTETTGAITFNGLDRVRKPGAVGVPLPGVDVRLVRPDGSDVDTDEVGEVLVSGPVVMKGYWNRPEETARTMTGGWLRTGDLGVRDADGDIRIVDRTKDLIIRGGHNVYPREVEEVFYGHPDIVEVAVIGVPDEHYGQEVGAVIATRPGVALDPAELRAWAKRWLSGYKVPRLFRFVDALPKGPTGKVHKRAITMDGFLRETSA